MPPQMRACAPQTNIVSHKRELCPKEINRLGATGVQIEAKIDLCHRYFCNFCGLLPDFWDEDPFFLRLPVFGRKNCLNF